MKTTARSVFLGLVLWVCCTAAMGDDWPQWLGPQRDSVWREQGILRRIPEAGLAVRWRTPVAGGYSGPAVAGGRVYVTDYIVASGEASNDWGRRTKLKGRERVWCLDALDGSMVWKYEYSCDYDVSYPAGPRATPTVVDGRVYVLGTMGDLLCIDAKTAMPIWRKDFKKDYGAKTPMWGFSCHPLIDSNRLICLVGGEGTTVVAFDTNTGGEIWRALSASEPGYSSPVMVGEGDKRQLIVWHSSEINGLDPLTGKVHWSIPLKPNYGMSIATPRFSGDIVFASGMRSAGAAIQLDWDEQEAEVLWQGEGKRGLYSINSTPFIADGVIYGNDQEGGLRAVRLDTGEPLWETFEPTTGAGRTNNATVFIVRHEDRYFLFNDGGDLILARLRPEGYAEVGRFHVLEPTNEAFGRPVVWSHPAFAYKCCYARNDKEAVCVSLAGN